MIYIPDTSLILWGKTQFNLRQAGMRCETVPGWIFLFKFFMKFSQQATVQLWKYFEPNNHNCFSSAIRKKNKGEKPAPLENKHLIKTLFLLLLYHNNTE